MMEQCSTLTVLRDGVIIDNIEKENFDPDDIKQKMVGREIKATTTAWTMMATVMKLC